MGITGNLVLVISRQKAGMARHVGVLLPDGRVAHCSPEQGEHVSTIEEFADGRDVKIDRAVSIANHWSTVQRVISAMQAPKAYDLVTNNCEIFANRVTGEKEESPQLKGAVILLAMFALLALATAK